eukprot:maker-scaffold429_size173697-snap-gene-0.39 protein:Tk09732 transcript:maker-scaffold429_size173697-snap-gene-0.39-mRNA-1 annotation:"predicted protein"
MVSPSAPSRLPASQRAPRGWSAFWIPVLPGLLTVLTLITAFLLQQYPEILQSISNMSLSPDEEFNFLVNWYDEAMDKDRKFTLTYFPRDQSVEMYDLKLKRIFLKRIHCEGIRLPEFYIGNHVVVLARRLQVLEYGDEITKHALEPNHEATFAMVKPDGVKNLGQILSMIEERGFSISQAKMTRLSRDQAASFYEEHAERAFFPDLLDYITSGPVVALELMKSNAVAQWRQLLGPTDAGKARIEAPNSIRAHFGTDKTNNAAHGSDSSDAASRELDFFFISKDAPATISKGGNLTTCCIVKPHAVKSKFTGQILAAIQEAGFSIFGLQTFHLKYEHAEEFYEIYRGIVQDYTGLVKQLSSGRSLVLEIGSADPKAEPEEVSEKFRDLVGPADPDLARTIRPKSLRAKFGRTKDENGVHCTDLPEDGQLEVEYFFKILHARPTEERQSFGGKQPDHHPIIGWRILCFALLGVF